MPEDDSFGITTEVRTMYATEQMPEEVRRFIEGRSPAPKEKTVLDILEEKHMLTMIEYIDRHSPLLKSDIYEAISHSSGMNRKLKELEDLGIIMSYQAQGLSILTITEKGSRLAGVIRSISDTIENWESIE